MKHYALLSEVDTETRQEMVAGIPATVIYTRTWEGFVIKVTFESLNDVAEHMEEIGRELRSWVQCEVRNYRMELERKSLIKETIQGHLVF